MKIFAVAIPLMTAFSTIEKVSAGKPEEKPGASGALGFVAKGTTTIDGCEKFHVNLIVNFLPGDENIQGNFLFNCGGGDVCKVNIDCFEKKVLYGATPVITSGTVINDCPYADKGEVVYAGFRFGGGSTQDQFALGFGGCDVNPITWVDFLGIKGPINY
ncbi:hypothetical protein ACHAW5_000628 [Stephanodiscus triporus]|uniref:Uncharacterized protein n=1 Tax=Stephanodiscus triporus TaxID=2934178 RepID=A0ABD3PV74_9STRA